MRSRDNSGVVFDGASVQRLCSYASPLRCLHVVDADAPSRIDLRAAKSTPHPLQGQAQLVRVLVGLAKVSDERTPGRGIQPPCERGDGALLDLIAEVACEMFQAKAASVILRSTHVQLVVEAASGEAGIGMTGVRIPVGAGIAGRVFADGAPVAVDDVTTDGRFARGIAESTGYVPTGLMAAPLTDGACTIGVLEVLDRPQFSRSLASSTC